MMKQLAVIISIFLGAALAYVISHYYDMAPPLYLVIVLVAFGLFMQTVIVILKYNDADETDPTRID